MNTEFILTDYLRVIGRRKWIILSALSLTLLSTVLYTRLRPVVYKAQSTIRIQPSESYAKFVGDPVSLDPRIMAVAEARMIKSREVMEETARSLGWLRKTSSQAETERVLDRLMSLCGVEQVTDTNYLIVSASTRDPFLSAAVLGTLLDVYTAHDREERIRRASGTLESIAARKTEVEKLLRAAERSRQEFLVKNPMSGRGEAFASQLVDLELRRKTLLEKYTPGHPEVVKVDNSMEVLRARLSEFPFQQTELVGLTRELRMVEGIYDALNRQYGEGRAVLASFEPFVSVVNRGSPVAKPVLPNVKLNLLVGGILGLFLGFGVAFLRENLDESIGDIEGIERLLGVPVLGTVPHMPASEHFEERLLRAIKKEGHETEPLRQVLLFRHGGRSHHMQAYHMIRDDIKEHLPSGGRMSVVFSSSGISEGKTVTAVNFAIAAAHAGLKTLLVDADLRKPSISGIFGLEEKEGLWDILAGRVRWSDAVCPIVAQVPAGLPRGNRPPGAGKGADLLSSVLSDDWVESFPGIDNLRVITSGRPGADAIDSLESNAWPGLVREWKEEFEVTVFDSPPVLLFADPVLVARHADGVVLVYHVGRVAREVLKRAKEQVVERNARLIGVVMNDMKIAEMSPHYGFYYDYGHYQRGKDKNRIPSA